MIEIKKIYKKDIHELLNDDSFWNHSFLSISKHRLLAHSKNPNSEDNDIVLLLAYMDNELLGYMGVFIDKININGLEKKIGWLSTWWVHPKTKGTGIGREILNTMYQENKGQIGISQFTPSAKRVYDKSGYFTTLKTSIGIKAVLRSNLIFVVPALFPKMERLSFILKYSDLLLNIIFNLKLLIQQQFIKKRLKNVRIEYINSIDTQTQEFIKQFNQNDIAQKSPDFFEWLKAYNWVQTAPLLDNTDKDRYAFSMYDHDFQINLLKISENGQSKGFVVLQKRNYVSKILFTYYDSKDVSVIADVILLQNAIQNTREIICYDEELCRSFKKSPVFLYRTKKIKQSIISKVYGQSNFDNVRLNFGDGDCCFA